MKMQCVSFTAFFLILGTTLARPGDDPSAEHGPHHGGPHHLPPFARSASKEATDELKSILKDETLTREQLDQKTEEWANKQGGDVLTQYNEFKNKMSSMVNEEAKRIESSSLSDNLKNIARKLIELHNDKSLTLKATFEKEKALMAGLSDEDRHEIHSVLRPERPKRGLGLLGPPGPMDQIRVPDFLGKTTEEGRVSFKAILDNKDLTKKQLIEKLEEWASNQGDEIKSEYDKMIKRMEELKENLKSSIAGSSLSDEAKSAMNQLVAIFENNDQTLRQERKQRKELLDKQTEAVRGEMLKFLHENLHM